MIIKELELFTSKIEAQTQFYSQILALEIIEKSETSVSFQIGNSVLKFSYRESITPYHYAINIPSNQEQEALEWLQKRVDILKDNESEIQYFDFWDANAIYFYDEDGNIGEFIARKRLNNTSNQTFSEHSLLEISEIGFPTFDINQEYQMLKKETGMEIHSGNTERFCALGNSKGLFIIINKALKKEWYPTKDEIHPSDFNIRFIENEKNFYFQYKNGKLNRTTDS